MRNAAMITIILLPLADLAWNLRHLNIGLVDFYGLAAFAHGYYTAGLWPATPYFPAGYPLLLVPGGVLGSVLTGGYILSCAGLMLALWALYRLVREFHLHRGWSLLIVAMAWVSPTYRIVAGNPSVDPLYTGLGLLFLAAAITLWRAAAKAAEGQAGNESASGDGKPAEAAPLQSALWVRMALILPAVILPQLRYHAIVLLLPVLLILLIFKPKSWKTILPAAIAMLLSAGFGLAMYVQAYGEPPASVCALQVRIGMLIDQGGFNYETTDELFADYKAFCARSRSTSVFDDFGLAEILQHVIKNWVRFVRRGPLALLIIIGLVALVKRRPGNSGVLLAGGWAVGYTLVLSLAYYAPRSALLPVLVGCGIAVATAGNLVAAQRRWAVLSITMLIILGGYLFSSGFARSIITDRVAWAVSSRHVKEHILSGIDHDGEALARQNVATAEWKLLPLYDNPWCRPFPTMTHSWIDDPEIRPGQRRSIEYVDPGNLAAGWYEIEAVIIPQRRLDEPRFNQLAQSQYWRHHESLPRGVDVYLRQRFNDQREKLHNDGNS